MKGTMRERSKGVWELRVYTGRDPVTKRPRQVSRTFRGGKRDAQTELARLVTETGEGRHGGSNATVEVLLDRWLADAKGRVSEVTYVVYEDTAERIKKTDLALVHLNRLGVADIDACYAELREAGTTAHTLVQVHRYLRAALNRAVKWGWLGSNPTLHATKPRAPKPPPPTTSPDDVRALVAAAEATDPELGAVIFLGALTGLRRGELCGLRWSDVVGSELVLRRARVIARGKVVESAIKMRESGEEDRVPLDAVAIAVLEVLREMQAEVAVSVGVTPPEDGWLLSADGMGITPRRPDRFGREVAAAGKRAGLKTNPHKLRHFMATELVAQGTDIATVAARMRHRDMALTLRTYTHADPALGIAAAATIGAALTPKDDEQK